MGHKCPSTISPTLLCDKMMDLRRVQATPHLRWSQPPFSHRGQGRRRSIKRAALATLDPTTHSTSGGRSMAGPGRGCHKEGTRPSRQGRRSQFDDRESPCRTWRRGCRRSGTASLGHWFGSGRRRLGPKLFVGRVLSWPVKARGRYLVPLAFVTKWQNMGSDWLTSSSLSATVSKMSIVSKIKLYVCSELNKPWDRQIALKKGQWPFRQFWWLDWQLDCCIDLNTCSCPGLFRAINQEPPK